MELREYQLEGVRFLTERDHALLADQMGLGKTVQTITAMRVVHKSRAGSKSLVIAPAALLLNWEEELATWAPELVCRRLVGKTADRRALLMLPVSVLLASYETVRRDIKLVEQARPFDLVIIDEAQRIKNSSSAAAAACRLVPRRRSWALTGTPLENSPDDLVAIFRFVRPGLLGSGIPPADCHDLIRPYFLRRSKREVLSELPPIEVKDLSLELGSLQRDAYDELWDSRQSVGGGGSADLLALVTRLKQLCNRDPESGESCKLEALRLELETASADETKVLVFSQYVETLQWLRAELDDPRIGILHGGQNEAGRAAAIAEFKTRQGFSVLLVSLKAGGVGLNFNEAGLVVLFDRWWNPASEAQAIERAHRFGRREPLYVVRYLVRDSIEERIESILIQKGQLFRNYVEEAPVAAAAPFGGDELRRILDLPARTQSQTAPPKEVDA